jgi:hypothetical protein
MAVIPFPQAKSRHVGFHAPSAKASLPGRLSAVELAALMAQDFSACIQADAENGTVVIQAEDATRLSQYLELFGLRLPTAVKATQVLELCNDLRWTFGQAVLLAAQGGSDIQSECPGLNADKRAYARAVASQEHSKTRELARQMFKDRASAIFLC